MAIAAGHQECRVGGSALELLDAERTAITLDIRRHPVGEAGFIEPMRREDVADRGIEGFGGAHGRHAPNPAARVNGDATEPPCNAPQFAGTTGSSIEDAVSPLT